MLGRVMRQSYRSLRPIANGYLSATPCCIRRTLSSSSDATATEISIDHSALYNPPAEHSHHPTSDSEFVKHLKGLIKFRGGPISVGEYMSEVLTNPKAGYRMNPDVFGAKGDFIATTPDSRHRFGKMIGAWVMRLWGEMGRPPRVNLVELGPGRGTLMADLLCGLKLKNFIESLHVHLVECSPELQKLQHQNLKCIDEGNVCQDADRRTVSSLVGRPVSWHATLEQVPSGFELVRLLAELRQCISKTSRGWCEKMVDVAEDSSFRFVLSPQPKSKNPYLLKRCKWAEAVEIEKLRRIEREPKGKPLPQYLRFEADQISKLNQIEVCPKGMELTRTIVRKINSKGGGAIIIDHGFDGLISDSVQAIRNHKFVNLLDDPGSAYLRAYVDFDCIRRCAEKASGKVFVHGPLQHRHLHDSLQQHVFVAQHWNKITKDKCNAWFRDTDDATFDCRRRPDEGVPISMGNRYQGMSIVSKEYNCRLFY